MSPSPQGADDARATRDYGTSWQAIMQLARSGSSWSGHERNCVFLNCPANDNPSRSPPRFANISAVSGLDVADDGRALAVVDWDHDGDLDIWLRNRTAPRLRLMRNRASELYSRFDNVAVHLEGTRCNRDAVGARVELVLEDMPHSQRLVQSVRAGDAFLSQSSKWLHFGVGETANVKTLIVDWPGGSREEFAGVSRGGRFEVKQGTGRATRLKRRPPVSLPVRPYEPLPNTHAARVVLPGRIAMPTLQLHFDHAPSDLPQPFRPDMGPSLITFWSSSCPHCRQELTEFANHQEDFRGAKLNILAVCLDGLGQPRVSNGQETVGAREFLEEIRFPFPSARTTADSMVRVRHYQNALFSKYPEFVVPLSLLTDSQGQIVSIYRGKFSHDVFLRDRELLDQTDESLRSLALPLTGSWITKPATPSQSSEFVGRRMIAHAPEEGLRYYELAMAAESDGQRRAQLRQQIIQSHLVLASASSKAGDATQAIRHFDAAVRIAPKEPQVHDDYGVFLMDQGDFERAERHFRTALRLRPSYPAAQENLRLLMQRKGKDPAADGETN